MAKTRTREANKIGSGLSISATRVLSVDLNGPVTCAAAVLTSTASGTVTFGTTSAPATTGTFVIYKWISLKDDGGTVMYVPAFKA